MLRSTRFFWLSTSIVCAIVFLSLITMWLAPRPTSSLHKANLSIPFVANTGQLDSYIAYYTKTFGGGFFVTQKGELNYVFRRPLSQDPTNAWIVQEELTGARFERIKGVQKSELAVNDFKGRDALKWKSNLPVYDLLSLGEVYHGIELKLRALNNNVEKLFYLKPGADPDQIRIKLSGLNSLEVGSSGQLLIETTFGLIQFSKPEAYQEDDGKRKAVDVAYLVEGDEYRFSVGRFDPKKELVIDPLISSTFIGAGSAEEAFDIVLDEHGYIYLTGMTNSTEFPTTPGVVGPTHSGDTDAVVLKMDADLSVLLAATYVGGSSSDEGRAITLDSIGNVYVAGETSSSDLPMTGVGLDTTFDGATDGYVIKLNNSLDTLLASTFLGGLAEDTVSTVAINSDGSIYVAGYTESVDFPTSAGAFSESKNDLWDAFVSKLSGTLETLLASTFLGGNSYDRINGLALDNNGSLYAAGSTLSSDFPTTANAAEPVDGTFGLYDGFISKFDPDLSHLLASTYVTSAGAEKIQDIKRDPDGNVYVARNAAGSVRFAGARKYDSDLTTEIASWVMPTGTLGSRVLSLSLDNSGNVYLTGETVASDAETTPGSYDSSCGTDGLCNVEVRDSIRIYHPDAFIWKLNNDLNTLQASTFLGGEADDRANTIAVNASGNVYVAGRTESLLFPVTLGSLSQQYHGGVSDIFISRFDSNLSADNTDPPTTIDISGTIKTADGTDICAMVLASGQFTFSCNPPGVFSLEDLPREGNGTVKRQIYADGFFPKIDILMGSTDEAVVMTRSGTCPSYNTPYDPGVFPDSAGKRIDISGSVLLQDTQTPICAMVLANGHYMFSCDGNGSYVFNIPLDANGQFKLQVYADGFAPTIQTFDEFQPINDMRMARAVECQ